VDRDEDQGPSIGRSESRPHQSEFRQAEIDDLLARLKDGLKTPKAGEESVAAALHAIQRLALEADIEESFGAETGAAGSGPTCLSCGKPNRPGHKFCAHCGVPIPSMLSENADPDRLSANAPVPAQAAHHYYHHHYHHHYFSAAEGMSSYGALDARLPVEGPLAREVPRMRAPLGGPALSRTETAVRKVAQDWAQSCNTKQLDDLVDLYTTDAMVLRPNVPAVRGTAAIREFYFGVLDAGLGDVELETLRVEIFGDVAYETGKCKSLVPVAMGKRREERGKYLLVLNRQTANEWKIAADSWSNDLSLATPEPVVKPAPVMQAQRVPRKP
jgi:uncharacterized protein (TIGR02246 family)